MQQRFSFPAGCPVVIDEPGTYQITKLSDDSLLVERIDKQPDAKHEVAGTNGDGLEHISEFMGGQS